MAKWYFNSIDNGGKHQNFIVTAASKPEAIDKGIEKAKKKAAGDIITWHCTLRSC